MSLGVVDVESLPLGTCPLCHDVVRDEEECEQVAVRIDKTSSNYRRIAGEIVVPYQSTLTLHPLFLHHGVETEVYRW